MRLGYYGLGAAFVWVTTLILFHIKMKLWSLAVTIAFSIISLVLSQLRYHPKIKDGELAAKVRTSLDGPNISGGH